MFTPATQVNVGVSYQATQSIQVGAAWMYGRVPMLRAALDIEPKTEPFRQRMGAGPLPPVIRSDEELREIARANLAASEPTAQSYEARGDTLIAYIKGRPADCSRYAQMIDAAHDNGFREVAVSDSDDAGVAVRFCSTADVAKFAQQQLTTLTSWHDSIDTGTAVQLRDRTVKLAAEQGLEIDAIAIRDSQVDVAFTNAHYRTEPEAYGRLARVLMTTMPGRIETFRIVSLADGVPTRELVLPRSSLERAIGQGSGASEILASAQTAQTNEPASAISPIITHFPSFDWSIAPEYNQALFDPGQPYLYQLLAGFRGGVNVTPQWRIEGEAQVNIASTFNQLQPSNSVLPHVRSDQNLYYEHGRNGLAELETSYAETVLPEVYGLVRGGILESMFSGAGGEILWRPDSERWALGGTLYEVWQRGFDRLFDLRPYHVLTGHVSLYYESPWYDLDFRLDGGRYLAGDTGGTLTISRRFPTGIEIGLFATVTNVPPSKFGEGAFDKGFLIRIPLDFMVPLNSQSEFDMNLRPVTRDGGQMLQPEQVLYDELRRTEYGDYLAHADEIAFP